MTTEPARWSADDEMARIPLEQRHMVCPFGVGVFVSEAGPLCENCFCRHPFPTKQVTVVQPCPCRLAPEPEPERVRFALGHWTGRCGTCGKTWHGARRIGEHGRWEMTGPRRVLTRPAGTRAPDWFFDGELTVTGTSTGSVSLRSGGMLVGVSVVLPDRPPLEGQVEPFSLSFFPEGRREAQETILPDQATRERAREAIARAIRERLEEAARAGAGLVRARGDANYATRVFDLLE